jgi:hypothetical protein
MPLTENQPMTQRQTSAAAAGKENNSSTTDHAPSAAATGNTAGIIRTLPRRSRTQRRGRGRS